MSDEENKSEEKEKVLTHEDHMFNYFREMVKVDLAMEPLREHGKAMRENYVENEWLSRAEMSLMLKAYRANKNEKFDIDDFDQAIDFVKENIVKASTL